MNKMTMKHLRSGLCLMLTLAMVLGMLPLSVFAADSAASTTGVSDVNGDGVITYVAIGDAAAAGEGLEGNPYPEQVQDALKDQGFSVTLETIAGAGLRMDELNWLLSDSYQADGLHSQAIAGLDGTALKSACRSAVEKADLITVDLGGNNFAPFLADAIDMVLGSDASAREIDLARYIDAKTAASLEALLEQAAADQAGAASGEEYEILLALIRGMTYGYLGYIHNYDAAMAAITQSNPDAKVVVIDCRSSLSGLTLEGIGEDLAGLYGTFIDLANLYARELSPYASVTTHAALETAPEQFADSYADEGNLSASSKALMNVLVMVLMGYDPENADDRKVFEEEILESLDVIDSIVAEVSDIVEQEIVGVIVENVQTAVDFAELAIGDIEIFDFAVEYEDLAQQLVDMIVSMVIDGEYASYFKGSQTSDAIKEIAIDKIIEKLDEREDLIIKLGLEPTDENKQMLAEEIYYIACVYYDEMNRDGGSRESANRLSIIETLRFVVVTILDCPEDEAPQVAEVLYEVAQLFNSTIENGGTEKDAYIACLMETEDMDEATAEFAYSLYFDVYAMEVENGAATEDAKKAAELAALAGMDERYADEAVAKAAYSVYTNAVDGDDNTNTTEANMVTALGAEGVDEATAKAIYACYTKNLNGKYENANVQTTVKFLMVVGMELTEEEAEEAYSCYLSYKRVPGTLSKLAACDTLWLDVVLGTEPDMDAVGQKLFAGTLSLNKPSASEEDEPEAWAAYKTDATLGSLYLRFLAQDGLFSQTSEKGHVAISAAAKAVLKSLSAVAEDEQIRLEEDSAVLILGDFIAMEEGSYSDTLTEILGEDRVTDLSRDGFRLNDVRALLDDSYGGDDYTDLAADGLRKATYQDAVKNSDVILLHLGSMNMGFVLEQLELYLADGEPYAMKFSTVDSMDEKNLGSAVDSLISGVSGALDASAKANLFAFQSLGYGYTTFADCLDATVAAIRSLNSEAQVVLVGMYDLLGQAYIDDGEGLYLEIGQLAGAAVEQMNLHMANYASVAGNVTYIDMSDLETAAPGKVELLAKGLSGAANTLPTEKGFAAMEQRILCALGQHELDAGELTWVWSEDHSTASASAACLNCGEKATVDAVVTSTTTATCTEAGETTYTATAELGGETYTDSVTVATEALGHEYGEDGLCIRCEEPEPTEPEPTETEPEPTETEPTEPEPTESEPTEPEATEPDPTEPESEHKHSYGPWELVKDPSSKEEGLERRSCSCGRTEQRTIDKLTNPFTDVKNTDYFYEPVLWAVHKGITAGTSKTTFGPGSACTRGQIVTFLWRAAGSPEPESTRNPFSDVKKTDYFYKAVLWAVENEITAGVSATSFGPGVACTRAQVVTFLWRAQGAPEPESSVNTFTDVKNTDYFCKAVLWAVENGITSGVAEGRFGSDATCTRGQIATFLYKTFAIR